MLFILFVSSLVIVTGVNIKLLLNEKSNKISNLATCIHEIYDLHHNFYKLTIVNYMKKPRENIPNDIITKKNPLVITANINDLKDINEIYEGTILIVIVFKSCFEIVNLKVVIFDIKIRYIIILDTNVKDKCYDIVKTKLYELKNYNVIFITDDTKTGKYNLITAIPEIDEVTCNVSKIVTITVINICENGSLNKKKVSDIFPAKEMINLKMCNLNVGMATLYPHSMINNEGFVEDLDTTRHFYGSDVEIMKIMANISNSTLKLFYINNDKKNPPKTALVQYLLDGKLEAGAGGLYRLFGDKVAYSGIYLKQSIFWVYAVERDRRSWQSLVVKMTGLYIFLITYICYVILWNLMNQFDYQTMSIIDSLVYGWGALLGAADLQDARSIKQKTLNIMYQIMCLHLSAFVSTQIYYYLTIEGPPKQFKTTDEVVSSKRIAYLIPSLKFFVEDNKHIAYSSKSYDCDNFTHCVHLILKHKTTTVLIEGLLPKFQSESSIGDEASLLRVPDDIIISYHKIVLRKSSPLVKTFRKSIQRLFEAGICRKLYNEAIGITVVDKAKIANKNILSNSYSCTIGCSITLSQSAVAFYVWILGCCISCFVFILEILIKAPSSITSVNNPLILSI